MHASNSILTAFDLDTEEFFYSSLVTLYDENTKKPFAQVTFENGHYKLTVGDVEAANGSKRLTR